MYENSVNEMPLSMRVLNGVLGEHVAQREVLADVAQELDQAVLREPLAVVEQPCTARSVEVQEALELRPDGRPIRVERVVIEQVALGALARRVADHPGAAADNRDRRSGTGPLQRDEHRDRHQVAHLERGRGRVEADIAADRPARQPLGEALRLVLEEAAPLQLTQEGMPLGGGGTGFLHASYARVERRCRPAATAGRSDAAPNRRPVAEPGDGVRAGWQSQFRCSSLVRWRSSRSSG